LGSPDGPGARRFDALHQELVNVKQDQVVADDKRREEIVSIKERIARYNVVGWLLGLAAPALLAWWLNSRFKTSEDAAVKPKDVAAAVQKAADMAAAKSLDDAGLFKQMLNQQAVDVSLPDVRAAKTKGSK
jgi:hypothetical protein